MSPDELREAEQRVERRCQEIQAARAAIVKFLGKWRKGDVGTRGQIPCPVCSDNGTLSFTRASSNGHISAICSTAGCVRWME